MIQELFKAASLVALLVAPMPASADFHDRGGGLIYDDDLDITWLQDASYAYTSGYDADGRMDRYQPVEWAEDLVYAGADDWRLPATLVPDPSCFDSQGSGCTGSDLGHLYYIELGNDGTFGGPKNHGPFMNIGEDGDPEFNYSFY